VEKTAIMAEQSERKKTMETTTQCMLSDPSGLIFLSLVCEPMVVCALGFLKYVLRIYQIAHIQTASVQ